MKSSLNIESKYFCDDFKPIRSVLREMGAKRIITKRQKDHFFNLPKREELKIPARLKLREENRSCTLIYYRRPEFSSSRNTPADILLLPVRDPKLPPFLYKVLGAKVIVEKRREVWSKGNAVFHLDKVKGVGGIFEIEVWTKPKTLKQDRVKFAEYRKRLLPYLGKIIKGSNENLLLKS